MPMLKKSQYNIMLERHHYYAPLCSLSFFRDLTQNTTATRAKQQLRTCVTILGAFLSRPLQLKQQRELTKFCVTLSGERNPQRLINFEIERTRSIFSRSKFYYRHKEQFQINAKFQSKQKKKIFFCIRSLIDTMQLLELTFIFQLLLSMYFAR